MDTPNPKRHHIWLRNTAFTRLTGVPKVCFTCGQPSNTADRWCPGKKPVEAK